MKPETYASYLKITRRRVVGFDLLLIALSPLFANLIKWQSVFTPENRNIRDSLTIFLLCLLWCFALSQSNAWDAAGLDNRFDIYRAPLVAAGKTLLIFSTYSYVFHAAFSREWVLAQMVITIIAIIISRSLINAKFQKSITKSGGFKPITYLVVSAANEFQGICEEFLRNHRIIPTFVHIELDTTISDETKALNIYRKLEEMQAEGLILMSKASVADNILRSVQHLRQPKNLKEVVYVSQLELLNERMRPMVPRNWFRLGRPRLLDSQRFIKRALDIAISFIALVVLAPFFVVIALLIKLTSRGPIFYVSERVGRFNKPFRFIKFRTMIAAADQERASALGPGVVENLEDYKADNRITKFGKFLRRFSIDETPQFLHVLYGSMSLVGPRPILFEELADVPNNSSIRFIAKPGLTGIWQVNGRKSTLWDQRMRQDLLYVETWSFLGDIKLIIKTFFAVVKGDGAA